GERGNARTLWGSGASLGQGARQLRRRDKSYLLLDGLDFFDLGNSHRFEVVQQLLHQVFGSGGAGGEGHALDALEPRWVDFGSVINQVGSGSGTLRHFLKAFRVRAVVRTHHQDQVRPLGKDLDGGLAVLGGVADVIARGGDQARKAPPERVDDHVS